MAAFTIRPGRDDDAPGIIDLIRSCWSAYPGIVFDVDAEMPELRNLATYYGRQGGRLWIAERDRAVAGMVATRPHAGAVWEICRVYVLPALHGAGLGHDLLDTAETHAIGQRATELVLWSDTRFNRAHRFYEKRSYVRHGPVRVLNDLSNSLEYAYAKPVDGVWPLDAAAAASAERRVAAIMRDGEAPQTWRDVAKEIALGHCVAAGGWRRGVLAGFGVLSLGLSPKQRHRAEVRMLCVDEGFRRQGLGRGLLRTLENQAAGRRLLCGQAVAAAAAEALFRAEGWSEHGRLPGYVADACGTLRTGVFFHKWIG